MQGKEQGLSKGSDLEADVIRLLQRTSQISRSDNFRYMNVIEVDKLRTVSTNTLESSKPSALKRPGFTLKVATNMHTRSATKKSNKAEPTHEKTNGDGDMDTAIEPAADNSIYEPTNEQCHTFTIPFEDRKDIPCELRGGPPGTTPSIIWTHGAGGGIDNPATRDFAIGFAQKSPLVVFQSNSNLPNRIKTYETVVEHVNFAAALSGRSMGARAAGTIAAEDERVEAVVLVSYPLIGKGGDVRDEILLNLPERVEVLFMIGSRDHMCPSEQFEEVRGRMKARSWLVVAEGADHGMALKKSADSAAFRRKTGEVAAEWLKQRDPGKRLCEVWWDDEMGEAVAGSWRIDDRDCSSSSHRDAEPERKKQKVT